MLVYADFTLLKYNGNFVRKASEIINFFFVVMKIIKFCIWLSSAKIDNLLNTAQSITFFQLTLQTIYPELDF